MNLPAAGLDAYFASHAGRTPSNTHLYFYISYSDVHGTFDEISHREVEGPPSGGGVPLPSTAWMGLAMLGALGAGKFIKWRKLA
jgi:hypothetical protein